MVQWLRLCALNAGGLGSILIRELDPHMLQLKSLCDATKTEDPESGN